MDERDTIGELFNLAESAMNFLDENEDSIASIMGDGTVNLQDDEPLREMVKDEDKVRITTETEGDFDSISISKTEEGVVIEMNDKSLVAKLPDDVEVTEADANLNNGILDVRFPREGDD